MKQTLIWGRDDRSQLIVRKNFPGTPFGVPESDVIVDVVGFGPARLLGVAYRDDIALGRIAEVVSLILDEDRGGTIEAPATAPRRYKPRRWDTN